MERVAKFERVSKAQFAQAFSDTFGNDSFYYDEIKLPRRATVGAAGYDFFSTVDFTLSPGQTIKIPTGIRAKISEGYVLMIFPRSGLGFKYRLQLDNTVGVVDSDYYGADNEGHIFIKISNNSNDGKTLSVKRGEAFAQGIFMPFGITDDDEADGVRHGGFGSTGK